MHNLFKRLIIIFIIIITFIVLRTLLAERNSLYQIKTVPDNKEDSDNKENFAIFNTPDSEFLEFKQSLDKRPTAILNYSGDKDLPLKEYCIKSSYNTAITGKYVSDEMIRLVLSRGCRFIDLEILIVDDTPVVSHTLDKTYAARETDNIIILDTILNTLASNSFVESNPNPKDPLFIHLRVKSNHINALKYISASINSTIAKTNKLYKNKIDDSTTFKDIMGKFVLIIDNSNIYNFNKLTQCTKEDASCYDLNNYINSKSNNQFFKKQKLVDIFESSQKIPTLNDNGISDKIKINIGLPDTTSNTGLFSSNNTENPNIREIIYKYGIQISGFKYYLIDDNFLEHEGFFNFFKSAFVPFKRAMPYLNKYYE